MPVLKVFSLIAGLLLLAEFVLITVLFCWIVEKDITSNGREDLSQCANYMKTSSLWWKNVGYKLYKKATKHRVRMVSI
ncbi:hypothetical protein LINGRAHAP2_LOCUS24647 [Linum grandiflorum]